MSVYTYVTILRKAKECKSNVEKKYELGITDKWSYYMAKAILKPHTDIKRIDFKNNKAPKQDIISRQATEKEYKKLAEKLIKFVEKKGKLPDWVNYGNFKLSPRLLTYNFAKILLKYDKNNKLPDYVNLNSKCFTKPVEYKNEVYKYWVEVFKFAPKTMDEILSYVAKYFTYQHYFDDNKSNKQVIDTKSGNCTDLLQMLVNMLKELGYEVVVIHVKCKGGDGHVRLKARHKKHTGNQWVYRDIACVANGGGITCNWCMNGTILAYNPSWFMENLNR